MTSAPRVPASPLSRPAPAQLDPSLLQLEWLTRDEEGNPAPEAEDCLVIMPQVNTCELKQVAQGRAAF